ncbi:S-layer homology domain-containing protein [Collinsella tanakaei]|nr:S-layer homology domain-containing protein [Collinsella tanakaei]
MTACVNRKHTKKVAAVVTASLVGALSLGVAPVAAVADTGIDMQALDANDAFAAGKLTAAVDGNTGIRISIPSDGVLTLEAGQALKPTEVTPAGGADPIELTNTNSTVKYGNGFNATCSSTVAPTTAGNYTVEITMTSGYYAGPKTLKVNFVIEEAASLDDAVLVDGDNADDTTFTYDGAKQDIRVAIDGKVLSTSSYTMTIAGPTTGSDAVNAGDYTVTITGQGSYLGQSKTFSLNVAKLDLSKADITVADQQKPASGSFGGTLAAGSIKVGDTVLPDSDVTVKATYSDGTGSASAKIASNSTNVSGTANVEFNIVDKVIPAADFSYDGNPFTTQVKLNLSDGDAFKASDIKVADGSTTLPASYYTVTYTDADGNEVDASALQQPGTYYVKVRIDAAVTHYAYGSATETLEVVVSSGTIDVDDIVFKFDGKVGTSFSKNYDGADFLDQLDVTITTEDGELSEGTDYTFKVTDDTTGEEVDSIVDAGSYTIVLDIPGYNAEVNAADRTCKVTVNQLNLSTAAIIVNGGDLASYTYDVVVPGTSAITKTITIWYLNYTGEEQDPSFELGYYTDKDGNLITPTAFGDGKYVDDYTWHGFSADDATVTEYEFCEDTNFASGTTKSVDAIKDKGNYKVEFHFDSPNFTGVSAQTTNYITVSDSSIAFADVDPNAWYAQSVFQAKQLGYIKGISGSNIYAPNASITRADALVIISRMSGADQTWTAEDYLNENAGFLTRYTDVDSGAYYAKAVAWGTKVGIVHGYGDGTFRPDEQITREEFAAMLANYAEAMGKDISVDADAVLAEFPDGSQVSDWAEGVVAWAADSEIMGNGGVINPQSQITRAEVAAMAVNYQPENVNDDIIG